MSLEQQERVEAIARLTWVNAKGETTFFLSDDEVMNLKIAKDTLTDEERQTINHHIVATIKMLDTLPWPKHLKRCRNMRVATTNVWMARANQRG